MKFYDIEYTQMRKVRANFCSFFLPRAPRTSKHDKNWHVPCALIIYDAKNSDFFWFFCYFLMLLFIHALFISWSKPGWLGSETLQGWKVAGFESSWCNLSGFRVDGPKMSKLKNWEINGLFSWLNTALLLFFLSWLVTYRITSDLRWIHRLPNWSFSAAIL